MYMIDVNDLSSKNCTHKIRCELKYCGSDNFLGRPVSGYSADAADFCLLAPQTALALCNVQNDLIQKHKLGLLVLDGFRPLRAVKDFGKWMQSPPDGQQELVRKKIHYPSIEKNQLEDLGYVGAKISNHCFGNTVDVVLVSLETGKELDMGSIFDYFGEISHPTTALEVVGEEAFRNRQILIDAMDARGFKVASTEYWHFEYSEREFKEPQDFEIVSSLKYSSI